MALFLDTRGRSTLGIGICDRCKKKFPLDDLMADGNSPGLRVCYEDRDPMDPWRLAPLPPDRITLRYPRPDTSLVFSGGADELLSDIVTTHYFITEAFIPARLIVDNTGRLILNKDGNAMIAGRAGTGVYIKASVGDPDLGLPPTNAAPLIADGTGELIVTQQGNAMVAGPATVPASVTAPLIVNGIGQLIVTPEGYAFIAGPGMTPTYIQKLADRIILNEETRKLAIVPRNWGLLVNYGPLRWALTITAQSHGIWINPIGGPTGPGFPGSVFCKPGIPYKAFAAASQPAVTYWTDVAGVRVAITSEEQPL